jgi:RND family efflux transporter MFP subunit
MTPSYFAPLANHLWQSTLFAAAAGLLTLPFRRNRAAVRHRLWLAASVKFLVPFSALIALGGHFQWRAASATPAHPISIVMDDIGRPFTAFEVPALPVVPMSPRPAQQPGRIPAILLFLWICGFALNVFWWSIRWRQLRRAVRQATLLDLDVRIRVMSCPQRLEPGVFGIVQPVLLLPEGITERLSPAHLHAVVEHELCHVRRRDNLTAAVQMVVETLFWFHPLVWWIRLRLVEEQERACDEEVLGCGCDPQVYAESILKICEFYLASPLICVAGITGSNLKRRIEAIMTNRISRELNPSGKLLLAAAGMLALAGPIVIGILNVPQTHAQSKQSVHSATSALAFSQNSSEVSVLAFPKVAAQLASGARPAPAPGYMRALGTVAAFSTVTVKPRVDGQLMTVVNEGDLVQVGQILASIDPRPYQIQLLQAVAQLDRDRAQLADARLFPNAATNAQLESSIKIDEANVENAKVQVDYTEIHSPITGVAGLHMVDPGNIVFHDAASPGILVITQLQPIAVVFSIPEDNLPQVRARLTAGTNLPVEVWDHDDTVKIATGRLTAVDNQIDLTTGTAKLKAVFDNKDGALFPNQFVNVRMFLSPQ